MIAKNLCAKFTSEATADYYYALLMTQTLRAPGRRKTGQTEGRKRLAGEKSKTRYAVLHLSQRTLLKQNAFRLGGFLRHIALPRLGFADLDAFFLASATPWHGR